MEMEDWDDNRVGRGEGKGTERGRGQIFSGLRSKSTMYC